MKKRDMKDYMLCGSLNTNAKNKQIHTDRVWRRKELKDVEFVLGDDGNVLELDTLQHYCEYTKSHQSIHFKVLKMVESYSMLYPVLLK
jgi:hypothetical protein